MRFNSILIFMLMLSSALFAEDNAKELRSKYGIFGHYSYNMHNADFSKMPDCPSCSPGYKEGNGSGFAIGLAYELPLSEQFVLELRLSYYNFSALLTADEITTMIQNGSPINGVFEHSIDATLTSLGLEPMLKWNIYDGLYLNAGLHIGTMLSKDYAQKEEIINPKGATYLDVNGNDSYLTVRNQISGTLANTPSIYLAPLFGISYQLPLNANRSLLIEPEMYYTLGLSKIVDNAAVDKWSANSFRAGIALKYSPAPEVQIIEKYEKIERIDTVKVIADLVSESKYSVGMPISKIEVSENNGIRLTLETITRTDTILTSKKYKLYADIQAVGVDNNGNEVSNPTFKIEEFSMFRLEPLLNYVFFEENSSLIPNKYQLMSANTSKGFELDSLYQNSTLEIYYNVLNIVGKRMKMYEDSKITLTGTNSDIGDEKGNKELSQKRAESVRDYLATVWGISLDRMTIVARNLPLKASTPLNDPEKLQENRRVEIASNDYRITESLQLVNIQKTANPPIVRFKPSVESEAGISSWEFKAIQANNPLSTYIAKANSEVPKEINWELEKNQKIMPNSQSPIVYNINLKDKKNQTFKTIEKQIDIKYVSIKSKRSQMIDDYEIEKFNLILFDFDQSKIEGANKKIVDFIKSRIKPESEIEINGYTDRIGDAEYNKKLSERRAEQCQKSIARTDAKWAGIGEEKLLFENESPEGRFYCRTVEITVKTKVK